MDYLKENHPDVLLSLQQDGSVVSYVNQKMASIRGLLRQLHEEQKPDYIIEEICLDALTSDLGPSKYHYIREVLEEEFEARYQQLLRTGLLPFETINLIDFCHPLFEAFGFSEQKEQDKNLRYTIIGTIKEYFQNRERETRVSWPTMPIIN